MKLSFLTGMMILVVTPICFGLSKHTHADVFQAVDAQGVVHLSNIPADTDYKLLIRAPSAKAAVKSNQVKTSSLKHVKIKSYVKVLKKAANEQHLDLALLQAVIDVESNYDPQAVSSKGAVGLMQLMPSTAQRYGVNDRYNPAENIQGGAKYLHDLIQRYHNNLPLVLAAYNAGENAVEQHGNRIPPYAETRRYVPKVLSLYRHYRTNLP